MNKTTPRKPLRLAGMAVLVAGLWLSLIATASATRPAATVTTTTATGTPTDA